MRFKEGEKVIGTAGLFCGEEGTVVEDKGVDETYGPQGYMVKFDHPIGHAVRADPTPFWLLDDEIKAV